MLSRTFFGIMLLTISIRMCSLSSSVQGEHSRKTMLNNTHCSSSQELEDMSKVFRMIALTADTTTATRISRGAERTGGQRPDSVLAPGGLYQCPGCAPRPRVSGAQNGGGLGEKAPSWPPTAQPPPQRGRPRVSSSRQSHRHRPHRDSRP